MSPSVRVTVFRISVLALAAACGSAPAATSRSTGAIAQPSAPGATAAAGGGVAGDLCDVFTQELAVAALGQAVNAPSSGEVLPRPNGIYCHYAAAANASISTEAQLKDMPRAEFEALSKTLAITTPLPGVGDVAYQLNRSYRGGPGASAMIWSNGRGVTVYVDSAGDAAATQAAAIAIAKASLGLP